MTEEEIKTIEIETDNQQKKKEDKVISNLSSGDKKQCDVTLVPKNKKIIQDDKKPQHEISGTSAVTHSADSYNESELDKAEKNRKGWEEFFGGGVKILSPKEYENLKKGQRIFKILKSIGIIILFLALISLFIWFIIEFKNKDFSQNLSFIDNSTSPITVNNPPATINVNPNITSAPNIQMNVTLNIDHISINQS